MPTCSKCGNTYSFGSSVIPPAAPTANGPVSGLFANFDLDGNITEMESMGADLEEVQIAWERPADFFNTCYKCGSEDISWT